MRMARPLSGILWTAFSGGRAHCWALKTTFILSQTENRELTDLFQLLMIHFTFIDQQITVGTRFPIAGTHQLIFIKSLTSILKEPG